MARQKGEIWLPSGLLSLRLCSNVQGDVTALCDISASSKKKPLPGAAGGSIGCSLTELLYLVGAGIGSLAS